jgi:hypothetical protein
VNSEPDTLWQMDEAPADLVEEYRAYLERFDRQVGPCEFGATVMHQSRLIRKLRYEEFEGKWTEFEALNDAYGEITRRGDTISDVIVKALRDRSGELLIDRGV